MQKSKAIFSWSVTGLLTLLMVASVGAMTIKSAPSSPLGATQTTVSSGAATTAPVPSPNTTNARTASDDGVTTTSTTSTTSPSLTTVPAGSVIVPASARHEGSEGNEENESHSPAAGVVPGSTSASFGGDDGSGGN